MCKAQLMFSKEDHCTSADEYENLPNPDPHTHSLANTPQIRNDRIIMHDCTQASMHTSICPPKKWPQPPDTRKPD